jgi:hypothetical protein
MRQEQARIGWSLIKADPNDKFAVDYLRHMEGEREYYINCQAEEEPLDYGYIEGSAEYRLGEAADVDKAKDKLTKFIRGK